MSAGPGVGPGERDVDDVDEDDVALDDDPRATALEKEGRVPEQDDARPNENRPATTSIAPDALDEGDADE